MALVALLAFGIAGCRLGKGGVEGLPELLAEDFEDGDLAKVPVVLYFCDATRSFLVPEERLLPKVAAIGKATLEALCSGPQLPGLEPSLPRGTRLLSLRSGPDGLFTADFSMELTMLPRDDPKAEALAVYAIVNTLTQFPAVRRVQILVEGQKRKTLAGYVPVSESLARNLTFVKET